MTVQTQTSFDMTSDLDPPLVLSYGMGVDSTAVLVGWRRLGVRPDLILFADTRAEKKATYAYRALIDRWLAEAGFPAITDVRYEGPRHGYYGTLAEDCLVKGMLPSLAYGYKACSGKWKIEPIEAFLRTWPPARACWSRGGRLRHAIGYDAGPKDSRRGTDSRDTKLEDFVYPLRDWGWDRERCKREIRSDDLLARLATEMGMDPVPPKSACVFCPSVQVSELHEMQADAPEELAVGLGLERAALPSLTTVAGLFRSPTKTRPGSWTEYVAAAIPDARFASADEISARFERVSEEMPQNPEPGRRYAVRRDGEPTFQGGYREAVRAASPDLPIELWIHDAWFRIRPVPRRTGATTATGP